MKALLTNTLIAVNKRNRRRCPIYQVRCVMPSSSPLLIVRTGTKLFLYLSVHLQLMPVGEICRDSGVEAADPNACEPLADPPRGQQLDSLPFRPHLCLFGFVRPLQVLICLERERERRKSICLFCDDKITRTCTCQLVEFTPNQVGQNRDMCD